MATLGVLDTPPPPVCAGKWRISQTVFAYTFPEIKQVLGKTWGSLIILSQEVLVLAALDNNHNNNGKDKNDNGEHLLSTSCIPGRMLQASRASVLMKRVLFIAPFCRR